MPAAAQQQRRVNRRLIIGMLIAVVVVWFVTAPAPQVDIKPTGVTAFTIAPRPSSPSRYVDGNLTLKDLKEKMQRSRFWTGRWKNGAGGRFNFSGAIRRGDRVPFVLSPNETLNVDLVAKAFLPKQQLRSAEELHDAQVAADSRNRAHNVVVTPPPLTTTAVPEPPIQFEAVYELLNASTPAESLAPPCLVAHCPKKGYTAFRYYEMCQSAIDALNGWRLNTSAMDLSAAMRLKPKVADPALRTVREKLDDGSCDYKTQTPSGSIKRQGLAECIDPRWPLRLPLTLHRLSSSTTLTCYARGDMVCDIVGRSGGWEAELLSILSSSLATMRASGVRRLTYWREKRYRELEAVYGAAALQDAINRAANSTTRHAELAVRPPGRNSPFATTAEELDDIIRLDELAQRRMPGLKPNAGIFKAQQHVDPGEGVAGPMSRDERVNFQYGRGDNLYPHELMYDLRKLSPPQYTRGAFGVEYLDIGANVGAFILHLWRSGFPVTAFEALPYNMQLLSTTLCVNGIRSSRGGLDTPSVVKSNPSLDDEPSVTVHYTALGREKDLRCVMMSEDLNFGDTWISCNATHVDSTAEFPFQKYRRRGFVNMTRLDSLSTGPTSVMPHESKQRRRAAAVVQHEIEEVEKVLRELHSATANGTVPPRSPLAPSFFTKDYIMKIDVEGHEIAVMQGATAFLRSPQRPKMILSEIWKSLNITVYGEVMFSAGYHAVMPFAGIYATSVEGISRYKAEYRLNMDTIIWVLPEWRTRLLPLFTAFEDAAVATHIGSNERVKW